MKTVKEQEQDTVIKQFILAVRALIKYMNSDNEYNIAIVEEDSNGKSFEFSLEYTLYEDNRLNFQRRVSNLQAEEFISNVFDNIEDFIGIKYKRGDTFVKVRVPAGEKQIPIENVGMFSRYGILHFYRKIHIRILFVEMG